MLDVAIVGGGVCGLALAHSLQARHVDWRLFEARPRLGGRVLTATSASGTPLDLGPTWYWPGHQPSIARLVADLGLTSFAQTDDGRVLHLSDPAAAPQTVAVNTQGQREPERTGLAAGESAGSVHGGALRVAGGMAALVQALAQPLPMERLLCGAAIDTLVDHGDCVELRWQQDGQQRSVSARRVVLALPPRVAEAFIGFEPALGPELSDTLRATPTWMATAAKAAIAYESDFWRAAKHTGNAWVTHPQAVLAEVFDASTPGQGAALAGFAAMGAQARQQFKASMDLLTRNQLGQLFGVQAEDGELHAQDWAQEPTTCSPQDLAEDGLNGEHPVYGAALLAQPQWQGRLHFGGSETARQGGGYLEGALSAAARLRRVLAT
ncbi:MAG: FAD-dependent oxidoreductase [Vitreoscilla sp.]|nr:FAD-dependent oxidoreductase [Vitreoscilla sp.]MBP6674740.1 FAD-dependent oxidoreductase [Vitreoscilla sp.]